MAKMKKWSLGEVSRNSSRLDEFSEEMFLVNYMEFY